MARIQLRRGSSAFWTSENPTLKPAEPGYETDSKRLKFGDGVTPWRELPYFGGAGEVPPDMTDLIAHINSLEPHPVYDDGPSLVLLYENAKV